MLKGIVQAVTMIPRTMEQVASKIEYEHGIKFKMRTLPDPGYESTDFAAEYFNYDST